MPTILLLSKNLERERVYLAPVLNRGECEMILLEIENINNVERVDILFKWRGRNDKFRVILGLRALEQW